MEKAGARYAIIGWHGAKGGLRRPRSKAPVRADSQGLATARGKALRHSESRYKRLLEAAVSYVFSSTLNDGHVISTVYSSGCAAVTGFTSVEFAAEPYLWYLLVHPDDRDRVVALLHDTLTSPVPLSLAYRIRHKEGAYRRVRTVIVPCFDKKGRLVSYDGLVDDITEDSAREEALAIRELQVRRIMESIRSAVFSFDRSGRLIVANAAFDTLFAELAQGRRVLPGEAVLLDILPRRIQAQLRPYFARALAGERFAAPLAIKLRDGEGEREMECSFNPIVASGRVEGAAVVIRDATERMQAQRAVQTIMRCMAKTTGLESLKAMAASLEAWLGSSGVVIGERVPGKGGIRILAASLGGKGLPGTPYEIKGGACAIPPGEHLCYRPKRGPDVLPEGSVPEGLGVDSHAGMPIRSDRGEDLGILCVLSRRPIKMTPLILEIMEGMAAKAAAEIERLRYEEGLRAPSK